MCSSDLLQAFALIATLLAGVGLQGLIAFSVSNRLQEIGVRIALGAERRAVSRMVLREASRLAGSGIILGTLCAVISARLIRDLLFDVPAWDPLTLAGAGAILFVSALLASYVPARRAASVDPVDALRGE